MGRWHDYAWCWDDPHQEIKPNGSKWVFKRKTNMKGNVQIYNASFNE